MRWLSSPRCFRFATGSWTALVLAFLHLPIVVLVAYSFNTSRLNVRWEGFTLRWYAEIWSSPVLLRAAVNSLVVAVLTAVISVVLGTLGAWLLHRHRFRGRRWLEALVGLPIAMPEIILGVSLLLLFSTLAVPLGHGTVVVAHVTFCFPFVLLTVRARLQGLDPALEEAALDLGATPLRAFWLVIAPALRPAITAGALLAFTLSLDRCASSASRESGSIRCSMRSRPFSSAPPCSRCCSPATRGARPPAPPGSELPPSLTARTLPRSSFPCTCADRSVCCVRPSPPPCSPPPRWRRGPRKN